MEKESGLVQNAISPIRKQQTLAIILKLITSSFVYHVTYAPLLFQHQVI